MRDHLRWGQTFQAVMDEFTTGQVDELREYCRKLIAAVCAFDVGAYRASALAFDWEGYALVLERETAQHWWSLEVEDFPPHTPNGGGDRIRAARRAREKKERKENKAVAARPQRMRKPRRIVEDTQELWALLLRAARRSEFGHKLRRVSAAMQALGHNVGSQSRDVTTRVRTKLPELQTVLENVQTRIQRYVKKYKSIPSLVERIETTREIASGMRLESRLFKIGRLHIQLNTWTPIDPGFDQIWDTSLFGIRLVESETL